MTYQDLELRRISSSSESRKTFKELNSLKGIRPASVLPESNPSTIKERFFRATEKKFKALGRAMARVAGWDLPGKDCLVEYLRDMYRRNCKPSTFQGALFAIYIFLEGVKSSGKNCLAEKIGRAHV